MKKTIIALITAVCLLTAMMPAVFAGDNGQTVNVRQIDAPKTISATASGWNKITVKWSKCETATNYQLYYYNTSKKAFIKYREIKGTSFTVTDIKPGRKYYFKVKAVEYLSNVKVSESALSATASATTRLNAPSKIKAKTLSDNSIKITWKKVKGAYGYAVYKYNRNSKKYKCIAKMKASRKAYTDKKTGLNKKYYYKVKALAVEKKYVKKAYKKNGKVLKKTVAVKVYHPGKASTAASAKTKSYKKKMLCKITAYCDSGYTASGLAAGKGRVAVDPSVISLGSKMYVSGYGNCIAADTGGAVKGHYVDIWLPSESSCNAWGVRYKTVYVY